MTTRLEQFYKEQVVPKLMERFGYANVMQVPRLTKITLNMGVGEAVGNKKILENAVAEMAKISGQKPVTTKARVSVASFKIRDGWPIGCKVTLRRAKMFEFLDRLVNISL
uniref:large ribosomal subunit protein uL5 n=1 Tax=Vogesella mureinivorans TaxID=657276 RepID=UPI0011CB8468